MSKSNMRKAGKASVLTAMAGMMVMTATGADAAKPRMLQGNWGGDRMNLVMGPTGGEIRMDCASGTIKGRVMIDAKGNFTARGTFDQEKGGPIRAEDFANKGKPAIFRGQMKGDMISLSVTKPGATETQRYTLHKGHNEKLVRCL
jgi:hypothetical protein